MMQTRHLYFTDTRIVEMLDALEHMGFDLSQPQPQLEEMSLAELDIFVQDARERN
jgi:hypothetical protein